MRSEFGLSIRFGYSMRGTNFNDEETKCHRFKIIVQGESCVIWKLFNMQKQ